MKKRYWILAVGMWVLILGGCNQQIAERIVYQNIWNYNTEQYESRPVIREHFGKTNFLYWFSLNSGSVVIDPNGVFLTATGLKEKPDKESLKAVVEAMIEAWMATAAQKEADLMQEIEP